jgi:PAS domain S-box-containing protein
LPLDQVLESLSAIVVGLDATGAVSAWNGEAQRALGLERTDVLGRHLSELALPLRDDSVVESLLAVAHGDKPVRMDDIKYVRQDGAEGLLGLTASPMARGADGRRAVLVLGRDITEHRLRDSQHMQSQKLEAIGQLAAGIAHEINTPTQYVTDNLHFLRDSFRDLLRVFTELMTLAERATRENSTTDLKASLIPLLREIEAEYLIQEVPRAIEQALEGTSRVAVIVRAMRGFSHPGQQEMAAADVNRAVQDTATVSTNEWRYSAEMVLDLEPDLPYVVCHIGEVSQVFLNLIVNAADAVREARVDDSGPKGKITISTRSDGDGVVIRVSDTGVGIPEKIRTRIFDPFFTTKPVGKGTGQGLSLARSVIVEKHRGTIAVESEPGAGTTFIVRLPRESA